MCSGCSLVNASEVGLAVELCEEYYFKWRSSFVHSSKQCICVPVH